MMIVYDCDDRVFPDVIAGVSARSGDSSAEQQTSVAIVKECVTRCFSAELSRLDSINIRDHSHTRNCCGGSPEVRIFPT